MTQEELIKDLSEQGYSDIREIPGRGLVGLQRFFFTTGLCYGLDESGYEGRYCYSYMMEARTALGQWDGVGDPPGSWMKHKGRVEYSNPNWEA